MADCRPAQQTRGAAPTGGNLFLATANVCGYFTLVLSMGMLVPAIVDAAAGHSGWQAFLASAMSIAVPSALVVAATQRDMPIFNLRFGFLLVNSVWLTACVVSALPLYLSDQEISFTDAVFEAASGITATGSTVLTGLDNRPAGLLLWRSMMQWFGGLGVIAMALLLLPFLKVGGMQIYKMESSVQSENPFSRFASFGWALIGMYFTLTLLCMMAYILAGMGMFEAINHAMTTVATGGYSTHDASLGQYGNGVLVVSMIFMIAGAMPFIALLHVVSTGDLARAFDLQIPVLLSILTAFSIAVAIAAIRHTGSDRLDLVIGATFNVISVITTTGYASTDYTLWGPFAVTAFLVAMFLGGAAGSTSGGIKTYRLIILYQALRNGLQEMVYPNGVFIVRYDGKEVPIQAVRSVGLFLSVFIGLLLALTMVLGATGLDLITSFSGALTALTNVGPGLGETIGPKGNFSTLEPLAKWALTFGMIAGRLEILSVLVLLSPTFWNR